MAETVEQLASEKARTPPRPKGRPTKIGGKPQPIPVQNAGPGPGLEVDSGEPEIEIDPKQLQVMVHNWLTVLADIPCQMMRARPLTVSFGSEVKSGKSRFKSTPRALKRERRSKPSGFIDGMM